MTHAETIKNIFKTNLGLRPPERLLVFTDKVTVREKDISAEEVERREKLRHVARLLEEAGRGFAGKMFFHEYPSVGGHGKEPPESLWRLAFGEATVDELKEAGMLNSLRRKTIKPDAMEEAERVVRRRKRSAVDAVVAVSNYSTSHTSFRAMLTTICGTRYASMPLFDMAMFDGPMRADYRVMNRRTKAVAAVLKKSISVRITTPDGTDITFSTKGRSAEADTGLLTRPGAFGNLPAGEAYLAPLEGTAEGRLVLMWAPTHRLDSPVIVTLADGMVQKVEGSDPYVKVLEKKFSERTENGNLAELGVGTNEFAVRPDNILESEKILGTVHMAFGDNSSFGGTVKTPFHQDFIFFKPTVEIAEKGGGSSLLLQDGKLLVGMEGK